MWELRVSSWSSPVKEGGERREKASLGSVLVLWTFIILARLGAALSDYVESLDLEQRLWLYKRSHPETPRRHLEAAVGMQGTN